MSKIENKCQGATLIKWQDLKDLQPMNLKIPYHTSKIKQSIVELGFASPFDVWIDPETNEMLICDGHGRKDILMELIADGYEVPTELPCTYLDNTKITTRKEAIKYLLNVFNMKTNPINEEVAIEWLKEENIVLEEENIILENLDIKIEDDQILTDTQKNIEARENNNNQITKQLSEFEKTDSIRVQKKETYFINNRHFLYCGNVFDITEYKEKIPNGSLLIPHGSLMIFEEPEKCLFVVNPCEYYCELMLSWCNIKNINFEKYD